MFGLNPIALLLTLISSHLPHAHGTVGEAEDLLIAGIEKSREIISVEPGGTVVIKTARIAFAGTTGTVTIVYRRDASPTPEAPPLAVPGDTIHASPDGEHDAAALAAANKHEQAGATTIVQQRV